jgi:hypothetical protein
MITRRQFTLGSFIAAAIPAQWLLDMAPEGEPIIGMWSVMIPATGTYRVMADGLFSDNPIEDIAIFKDGVLADAVVRSPKPGEGGELVVGTRVEVKAGTRIALDCSDEVAQRSQPRIVAVPLKVESAKEPAKNPTDDSSSIT